MASVSAPSDVSLYCLVTLLTLLAYFSLALYDTYPNLKESEETLFASGLCIMVVVFCVSVLGPRVTGSKDRRLSTCFFLFTVWSANIDLFLALSLIGKTQTGSFYLELGEEYFKTPWGVGSLLWDGTAHYVLQVLISLSSLRMIECTGMKLFWCGSIINSMPVLLMGAAIGVYSGKIHAATAFNYPYVLVPISIAFNVFLSAPKAGPNVRINTVLELLFAGGNLVIFGFHALRCMSVLGSRASISQNWIAYYEPELGDDFARPQVMQNFFCFSYWHIFAVYESVHRILTGYASRGFGSKAHHAAIFFAGCFSQSQFCYMLTLNFDWESYSLLPKDRGFPRLENDFALLLNIAMVFLPIAQAIVWTDAAKKTKQA